MDGADNVVSLRRRRSLTTAEARGAGRISLFGSTIFSPPRPTQKQWAAVGARLRDPDKDNWAVADWWVWGRSLGYGARTKIMEAPGWTGPKDRNRCEKLGSLARRFPPGTLRRHKVSVEHYFVVQALAVEHADRLLADAASFKWNKARLRHERYRPIVPDKSKSGDIFDTLPAVIATGKRYGAVLADFPWLYRDSGRRGGIGARYPMMSIEDGCKLGPLVQQVVLPDSFLFLWVTSAYLHRWYMLMEACGFEYTSSSLSWHKTGKPGVGECFRIGHEIFVVGKRGNPGGFLDHGLDSRLIADRGAEHSEKPAIIHDYIMRACKGPYLELFARRRVPGWDVVGDQVE